jgi:hypothetical protein
VRADLDLDLGKVNRTRTPWLVFGMHRPFFDSSAASALPELAVMRDALEPLMLKYKVISTRFEVQGAKYKALQHALRCGVFQPTPLSTPTRKCPSDSHLSVLCECHYYTLAPTYSQAHSSATTDHCTAASGCRTADSSATSIEELPLIILLLLLPTCARWTWACSATSTSTPAPAG